MAQRTKWILHGLGIVACIVSATAFAQSYPAKTIRFVVPYNAGGAVDITTRPIAQRLTQLWGQSAIVDNRPGASGMIGADAVARSAPDGYTILVSAPMEVAADVVVYKNMAYDPVKDLRPVTLATVSPLVLMVHPSLPVKSVKELVALARAKPGTLTYASIGIGTVHHFAGELMKSMLHINMVHVAYKGGAPALVGMLVGEVPVGFVALLSAIPNVRAGKLRALAVTSSRRVSALPEIPTLAESGLPGFEILFWGGIWVPAKTPQAIVDKLNKEMVKIIKSSEYKQRMIDAGAEAVGSTPEELRKLQMDDIQKYRKIAIEAGIKPQ